MPHVSKLALKEDIFKKVHDDFARVLAETSQQKEIINFLNDVLTRTEKTMLAKRLAIIIMLSKEYPFRVISRALRVSESTIGAMKERMDRGGGGFELILERIEKQNSHDELLRRINRVIRFFALPPYAGKRRWKFLSGGE